MATVAAGGRRSLLGKLSAVRAPRPGQRSRALAVKAALAVREHAATVAAFAAIDLGAFEACRPAGWIVTGVTVLLFEFKVRD